MYCTFSSTDNTDPGRSLTSTIIYRQHPTLSAHSTHIIGHIDLDNILALRQGNLRGQEPPSWQGLVTWPVDYTVVVEIHNPPTHGHITADNCKTRRFKQTSNMVNLHKYEYIFNIRYYSWIGCKLKEIILMQWCYICYVLELWLSPSIISDIEGKWFICDHLRGRHDLNGLNLFCKIKGNTPFQSNFSTH